MKVVPSRPPGEKRLSRSIAVTVGLVILAFFLWTEHRAHLLGVLPYLLILACPAMHLFMHHGGHGGGHDHTSHGGGSDHDEAERGQSDA